MDLTKEREDAERLARQAGALIMQLYSHGIHQDQVQFKKHAEPVTEADKRSNDYIVRKLGAWYPDDAILAEESTDDLKRLKKNRVWIIDPMDGTKEFIARNGEFAVMIGLAFRGEPVVGAVYLPAHNVLFSAAKGEGAFISDGEKRTRKHTPRQLSLPEATLVMSRSHLRENDQRLVEALHPINMIRSGSVGRKIAIIVRQEAHIYLSAATRGIKQWDTCAPHIILEEAGGIMSDLTGAPLRYNSESVHQTRGILAAANGELHQQVLDKIQDHLDFLE